ncbi:MAG TPA: PAS domain S-box protein [Bacteroidales bacterium]|nr:PAS domain S-box protein [Bacteroidales bacterium]
MNRLLQIWNRISFIGTQGLPDHDKRIIIILNRINLFGLTVTFLGFLFTVTELWLKYGSAPGIGAWRLLLVSLSNVYCIYLVSRRKFNMAKILSVVLPAITLIVFPTVFHEIKTEYYFYYPLASLTLGIITLLIFPDHKERKTLIALVGFCLLLAFFSDNLLTLFSESRKIPDFLSGRYFFYKLAQSLIFIFIIVTIYALKDLNTRYELTLAALNKDLQQNNIELEKYKGHLEQMVELKTSALVESESKFRNLFENANDVIFIMRDEVIVDCNYKTTEMFGLNKTDIIGKTPYALSPPYQPDGSSSFDSARDKIKTVSQGKSLRFEWKHKRSDGTLIDTDVSLNCLELKSRKYLLAIVRDITERKEVEQALMESEKKFRTIFDKSKQPIIIADLKGTIITGNRAYTYLSGYDAEKPMSLKDIILPDQYDELEKRLRILLTQQDTGPGEWRVKFSDGSLRIVETNSSIMEYNGEDAFLVLLRDITDMRQAEQKIMEAVIHTEESERSRISQDLHDGLGPVLSTIKIYFQVYSDTTDEVQRSVLMEKLKNTIEEAIRLISEISHNISPHVLRNYGFYAALREFTHQITLTGLVNIEITCPEEFPLSENHGITLYRAITELINNSVKHSACRSIKVKISRDGGELCIHYIDDGKGFDPDRIVNKKPGGSGLHNIHARIQALRGQVKIESEPDKGMTAVLKIPL